VVSRREADYKPSPVLTPQ